MGRERIEKEKVLLIKEREQAERLRKEAEIEMQRERVTQQRIKAQQELREVEKARFRRSRLGRLSKGAVSLGRKGLKELQK